MLRRVPSPWLAPTSFHVIWNRWRLTDSHPLRPSNQGHSQGQLGCYSKAGTKGGQIRNHQASGYRRNFPIIPWASLLSWFSPSLASSASCLDSYLSSQACFKRFFSCLFVSFFFALPPHSALDLEAGSNPWSTLTHSASYLLNRVSSSFRWMVPEATGLYVT